jgi:hypothetical protein
MLFRQCFGLSYDPGGIFGVTTAFAHGEITEVFKDYRIKTHEDQLGLNLGSSRFLL